MTCPQPNDALDGESDLSIAPDMALKIFQLTDPPGSEALRYRRSAAALFALVWLTLSTGCNSLNYTARNLPPEFAAPPPRGMQNADLSRLSRPQSSIEKIQRGDAIRVVVTTGVEQREPTGWVLRVADNGQVDVPIIGPVQVEGMELTAAEQAIHGEAIRRGKYVAPKVNLDFESRKTKRITVVGAVFAPNTYEIPIAACDILTAVASAKGFTPEADTIIEVRNPQPGVNLGMIQPASTFNTPQPTAPATKTIDLSAPDRYRSEDFQLDDGSVVVVREKTPRRVNVIGLVNRPSSVDIPDGEDLYLLQALSEAGGTKFSVANEVRVIRQIPERGQVIFSATIQKAKKGGPDNVRLAPGDVVSVEETPLTATYGAIQTFFRVGFAASLPGL
jgi:polysaccharide export outer membrane protein